MYARQDLREEAPQHLATSGAPPEWPSKGEIVFEEVCLRYREGLPLVLRSVSFRVRGGHKVGLVGRTGAGESPACFSCGPGGLRARLD